MKKDIKNFRIGFRVYLVCFTLLICFSAVWNIFIEYKQVKQYAYTEAFASYKKDLIYRRWASNHGGVYVPITDKTPANKYLINIAERDIITESGRKLTLINPAYMTRQVHELGNLLYDNKGHITSLNPIRPENKPDEWEIKALKNFEEGKNEFFEIVEINGVSYYRFMKPMITEESCLKCHSSHGFKVGEIRGGISVSVPMVNYSRVAEESILNIIITHFIIYIIVMILSFVIYKRYKNSLIKQSELFEQLVNREQQLQVQNEEYISINEEIKSSNQQLIFTQNCLEKNAELLKRICATTSDVSFSCKSSGNDEYCLDWIFGATVEIFGYTNEELIKMKCWGKLVVNEDLELFLKKVIKIPIGQKEKCKLRIIRKDKNLVWIEVIAECLFIDNQHCLFGGIAEITNQKKAENELFQREERFKQLIKNSYDTIVLMDQFGVQKFVSDSCERDLGFKPEELINIQVIDAMIHPDDISNVKDAFQRILLNEKVIIRYRHKHKNGSWVYLEAIGTNQLENPLINAVLINVRNISDAVLIQEELQLRQSYLSSIIENQPGLIWLKDKSGKFLEVNEAFAEACGMQNPTQLIGKTDIVIWPYELAMKYMADDQNIIINKKTISIEEPINDNGYIKWFETFKTPVISKNGEVIGTTGYARDISERKKTEEEIKASEAKFRSYYENNLDGIIICNEDGKIFEVNPAATQITGYSSEELCEIKIYDLIPEFEAMQVNVLFNQDGCNRKASIETQFVRKNKSFGDWIIAVIKLNLKEYLVFVKDITQRKAIEKDVFTKNEEFISLNEELQQTN